MYAEPKVQAFSAIASAAIVFGMALVLVLGLRAGEAWEQGERLVSVTLSLARDPPPEPPPPPPKPSRASAPKGDPAPRNLHNKATQVVAPPAPFKLIPPPPITTTPQANIGDAAFSGASDLAGPGQGAGGSGDGFGGGGDGGDGDGNGNGRGGGGPPVRDPRAIRDKLRTADIPESIWPSERGTLSIGVLYVINADGRVSDCRAVESSGDARADAYVCRLIEQRFSFRPALNRFGHPVAMKSIQHHEFHYR